MKIVFDNIQQNQAKLLQNEKSTATENFIDIF